jgi:hypothetical protein
MASLRRSWATVPPPRERQEQGEEREEEEEEGGGVPVKLVLSGKGTKSPPQSWKS